MSQDAPEAWLRGGKRQTEFGYCDACAEMVPLAQLAFVSYEHNGVGDGSFCCECRGVEAE